jgi:hypothetical protein
MISAMTRTRDLGLEPAAGFRGLLIEATARALIGAGTGVLVSFAYDSGILVKDGIRDDANVRQLLRLFLCVASGASERILPALVGRAESLVTGGSSTSHNDKASGGSGDGNLTQPRNGQPATEGSVRAAGNPPAGPPPVQTPGGRVELL